MGRTRLSRPKLAFGATLAVGGLAAGVPWWRAVHAAANHVGWWSALLHTRVTLPVLVVGVLLLAVAWALICPAPGRSARTLKPVKAGKGNGWVTVPASERRAARQAVLDQQTAAK